MRVFSFFLVLSVLCCSHGLGRSAVRAPQLASHGRATTALKAAAAPVSEARRKKYITGLLGASYLGTIVSVMTLPCTLSLVDRSLFAVTAAGGVPVVSMSKLLFLATMGTVAGKFLLGPPTDVLGGHTVMKLCLFVNAALLFLISTVTTPAAFIAPWIVVSFLYGATWGAVGAVVRKEFDQNEWSAQLGLAAAWSRIGSLGSSLAFGAIMSRASGVPLNSWRRVFAVAAALQAGILAIYIALSGQIITRHGPSITSTGKVNSAADDQNAAPAPAPSALKLLSSACQSSVFWGMLLGKATLLGVGQFIGFISLYLETGLGMSAAAASSFSGLFALGSLLSNLLASRIYRSLPRKTRIRSVTVANLVGVAAPLLLWAHANHPLLLPVALRVPSVLTLLTVWGAAWALAFYIPPGVIALDIGGTHHAALVTNIADGAGFTVAACFSLLAMPLGRRGGAAWGKVHLVLASFSAMALLSLRHAMGRERQEPK